MVSTRSKPADQTVLEDFVDKPETGKMETTQEKRKAETKEDDTTHVDKKFRTEDSTTRSDDRGTGDQEEEKGPGPEREPSSGSEEDGKPVVELKKSDDTDVHSDPIKINRAPVLDLFASCAAQFEHPDLPWTLCLSLGSAVASICAISKGRAIGQIPASNNNDDESSTRRQDNLVSVLGFHVPVRDGAAYVGDTKKAANEGYLKGRFGDRYQEVKETMQTSLQSWKGHEEEFSKKGFHMYEKFRPGSGQWGQVGGLHVEEVGKAILRP
ncbi:protein of unknown function [Taphrina deformans PYCC 5710]|uniref:Uncharacterized protein n=1 Tax=Taphrina deformans (strain PYCC 5710 / ATCC 11124 / CBS 356.35 / IMI 108563 / JCM 9778 / NBRC 8474) TaxID=1097556 RepID=R4XFD0_TAPDE|nr:protein of unknown function [Taphrina deformans PYCC 5710]|eukprot:CCG82057.1 protein of unknown function [Taphrina deformans PYCC 5710]